MKAAEQMKTESVDAAKKLLSICLMEIERVHIPVK